MASVPLQWTLSIKGGEEVTTTLNQLNASFKRGEISSDQYYKSLRQGNSIARQTINSGRYQNNILLAQYPSLLKISRGLSTVTSISRTFLTISNALNLSKIAGQGLDLEDINIKKQIRENNQTITELMKDEIKNRDQINALTQENNELMGVSKEKAQAIIDQKWDSMITNIFSVLSGIGIIFSNLINNKTIMNAIISAGSKLGSVFATHFLGSKVGIAIIDFLIPSLTGKTAMGSVGTAGTTMGAVFGSAFQLAAIVGIAAALAIIGKLVADELVKMVGMEEWRENSKVILDKFFMVDIPMAIGKAGLALSNFFLVDMPSWAMGGINFIIGEFTKLKDIVLGIINSIVNAIKSIVFPFGGGTSGGSSIGLGAATISAQQALSNRTGITTYDTKGNISTTPTKRATGFEGMVNTPQLMMVGDAGPEYVSVTPHGGTRSGGGTTIIVNVAGSIWNERQLFSRLDDIQKNNLKRRGFTGT